MYFLPIKGANENAARDLPMLANPIAEATSSNDSVYTNGPFPGTPLAHIPYKIQHTINPVNPLAKVIAKSLVV